MCTFINPIQLQSSIYVQTSNLKIVVKYFIWFKNLLLHVHVFSFFHGLQFITTIWENTSKTKAATWYDLQHEKFWVHLFFKMVLRGWEWVIPGFFTFIRERGWRYFILFYITVGGYFHWMPVTFDKYSWLPLKLNLPIIGDERKEGDCTVQVNSSLSEHT